MALCSLPYTCHMSKCPRNIDTKRRGALGVMVIVVGNGPGDTSSNSGRD